MAAAPEQPQQEVQSLKAKNQILVQENAALETTLNGVIDRTAALQGRLAKAQADLEERDTELATARVEAAERVTQLAAAQVEATALRAALGEARAVQAAAEAKADELQAELERRGPHAAAEARPAQPTGRQEEQEQAGQEEDEQAPSPPQQLRDGKAAAAPSAGAGSRQEAVQQLLVGRGGGAAQKGRSTRSRAGTGAAAPQGSLLPGAAPFSAAKAERQGLAAGYGWQPGSTALPRVQQVRLRKGDAVEQCSVLAAATGQSTVPLGYLVINWRLEELHVFETRLGSPTGSRKATAADGSSGVGKYDPYLMLGGTSLEAHWNTRSGEGVLSRLPFLVDSLPPCFKPAGNTIGDMARTINGVVGAASKKHRVLCAQLEGFGSDPNLVPWLFNRPTGSSKIGVLHVDDRLPHESKVQLAGAVAMFRDINSLGTSLSYALKAGLPSIGAADFSGASGSSQPACVGMQVLSVVLVLEQEPPSEEDTTAERQGEGKVHKAARRWRVFVKFSANCVEVAAEAGEGEECPAPPMPAFLSDALLAAPAMPAGIDINGFKPWRSLT